MEEQNKTNIKNVDALSVAAIRSTVIDGINHAKSGHPGGSLSLTPILYVLFKYFLVANPFEPKWINRDRLVMSYGHTSMLLYTMLHLCSYNVSIEDLKSFRQYGSITPGHPEVGVTDGVDASAGPLGQGIAQAVGMAIAETMLKEKYGKNIYNHYTYCVVGDGCLQEGISQEAITFAGLHKLNKLIMLYDKNDCTLDGPLSNSNNEDVIKRFLAAKWDVIYVRNGNNLFQIKRAIRKARKSKRAPTLIVFKTIMGYGSINQGSHKLHGAPLGEEDSKYAKENYGYFNEPFNIPKEVYDTLKNNFLKRGMEAFELHQEQLNQLEEEKPELYKEILFNATNDLSKYLKRYKYNLKVIPNEATRKSSQRVLNHFHTFIPTLVGGSADVASSVMTSLENSSDYGVKNRAGNNINFGIREFFMAAACNGILLHGGLRTYCGSFLVFSDYMKSAIRMSALSKLPNIYLFSHDSIAVGEDGPTHQPVEHLASLRAIPNLNVFRPADAKETYASYKLALESTTTPSAIVLTRQNLPLLENSSTYEQVQKGAYIIAKESKAAPDFTLIATGSEVSLALEIRNILLKSNYDVRVVSMPCQELFDQQSEDYKNEVLGKSYVKRASLEMESTFGRHKYAKHCIGIDQFGYSAPADKLIDVFEFNKDKISKIVLKYIKS